MQICGSTSRIRRKKEEREESRRLFPPASWSAARDKIFACTALSPRWTTISIHDRIYVFALRDGSQLITTFYSALISDVIDVSELYRSCWKNSVNFISFFKSALLRYCKVDYISSNWNTNGAMPAMRNEPYGINHQEARRRRRASFERPSLANAERWSRRRLCCTSSGTYVSEILFVPGTADRKSSLGSAEFNEWHHKSPEFERRIARVPHEPRVSFRAEFWRPWILGLPVDS